MQLSFTQKKNIRKNFGKLVEGLSIPNLIEVQKNSYNEFLKSKTLEDQLNELSKGIDKVFKSIFPIEDGTEKSTLEYISYKLEKPKFDVIECKQRSLSYSAALPTKSLGGWYVVSRRTPWSASRHVFLFKKTEAIILDRY